MRLVLFIGLSLFCFDQVILMSTGRIEGANNPGEILESNQFQLCDQMNNKTELMDMDDDCQLLVLEQLDFISLLSVAETNSRYKSLVEEIMKSIFREKMLDIAPCDLYAFNRCKWPGLFVEGDIIKIEDFSTTEVMLKRFGHHIRRFIIKSLYDPLESLRSVYKLVNLHCSKTLTEITLVESPHNYLDEFTNTFENVQNVSIWTELNTKRRLNEVFPAVRRLDLFITIIPHTDSINVKYKHLKHLGLRAYPHRESQKWATELITKNSHIRSLTLKLSSSKYIKFAADSIPHLEKLELDHMEESYDNRSIEFENVKELIVKGRDTDKLFLNVEFGNVEEVTLYHLLDGVFGETGFLKSNKHLKKLRLTPNGMIAFNSDVFKQFAHTPTTLKDIFIATAQQFELEPILQLIDSNKELKRLEIAFRASRFREAASEELRGRIRGVWSLHEFEKNLILKKK